VIGWRTDRRSDAADTDGQPDAEEHHGLPVEQVADRLGHDRSPAERQHAVVVGQCRSHRVALERAEHRFAVGEEDVADRAARRRLDQRVAVGEGHAQALGQQRPHGRLARPGRPDEDRDRAHGTPARSTSPVSTWRRGSIAAR